MKQMTFVAACKDFFGFQSGQSLTGIVNEIKALSTEDKAYFKAEFAKAGYEIVTAFVPLLPL